MCSILLNASCNPAIRRPARWKNSLWETRNRLTLALSTRFVRDSNVPGHVTQDKLSIPITASLEIPYILLKTNMLRFIKGKLLVADVASKRLDKNAF